MEEFQFSTYTPLEEIVLRLAMAAAFGLVLGLDRELRRKPAGLRTHMLVSVSAATTTLVTLELFEALLAMGHRETDPLRVVQGLAQAIGFICAGVIFVTRGDVKGVTTAANIWMCGAIGIAAGAGQYWIGIVALAFAVLILTVLYFVERWLPGSDG
ncbi:MgtC/SapB family protein [Arenibaculum sp.]|uniref:MgtC/SapB family protein n=1 Tax=Arenibaculum sp. TaxID=2865862 RepID=UPI002E0E1A92|nr:MgtC/SapB family protein [Arenibaculum sp.]